MSVGLKDIWWSTEYSYMHFTQADFLIPRHKTAVLSVQAQKKLHAQFCWAFQTPGQCTPPSFYAVRFCGPGCVWVGWRDHAVQIRLDECHTIDVHQDLGTCKEVHRISRHLWEVFSQGTNSQIWNSTPAGYQVHRADEFIVRTGVASTVM